ncbi:hypothetical protein BY458DRAFT_532612 [Sporodiniella umbellata]|nr:hypothetical protein BY458DRAFT_532612 [Sporodiniella umbellata]
MAEFISNLEYSELKDNPEAQSVLLMALLSAQTGSPVDESDHHSASSPASSPVQENEKRKFSSLEPLPKRVGRKPVTSDDDDSDDPKNKRKAQNRAAQRAFRERKENHVKILEERVRELEKSTTEKNTELQMENKVLKDMIERLQQENAAMLSSFQQPLSQDTHSRPQKVARGSPASFDSTSFALPPSSTLLDHSELLGHHHLPFDGLFSTDPKQFDLFSPPDSTQESSEAMVKLWDSIQHSQEEFDLDSLCDEMKKKAQCTEFQHNQEFSNLVHQKP